MASERSALKSIRRDRGVYDRPPRRWSRVVESITGLQHIEVDVNPPSDPYPAFVQIEAEGGSVLADDARAYALALLAAAEEADAQTEAMVLQANREGDRG